MVHQNDYPWMEKLSIVWKNKTTATSTTTNTDNNNKNNNKNNNNKNPGLLSSSLTVHNDSFFHIFSHASNKNLLIAYYVLNTVLSSG